jgi:hypothetical protein
MPRVSRTKVIVTSVCKNAAYREARPQVRKKYLELPIVLFELLKIVPTPSDFEHVQELRADFRLHQSARKNPGLTELTQVPMRRHLLTKIN